MTKEERIQQLENKYMGKTIMIVYLAPGQTYDDNPRYAGKVGTVNYIDTEGHLFGTWGGISILPDVDEFIVVNS